MSALWFTRWLQKKARAHQARPSAKPKRFRPRILNLEARVVPSVFIVTTNSDAASHTGLSLRDAILAADADTTPATIKFTGIGANKTITLAQGPLPALNNTSEPITIDGTTAPGFNLPANSSTPLITIVGSPSINPILEIDSAGNTIKALVVEKSGGDGIDILAGGNKITGSYLIENAGAGVAILPSVSGTSSGNTIGGTTSPSTRNVISGNNIGVEIRGDGTASGSVNSNVVEGNYIGTDATGAAKGFGGNGVGVDIGFGASSNTIGGSVLPAARNVISGNKTDGVAIHDQFTTLNQVLVNYIGVDKTGTVGLGNGANGVNLFGGARLNTIGGLTTGNPDVPARNVISGNKVNGVLIGDAPAPSSSSMATQSNTVNGSFIGLDATGTVALGNGTRGVLLFGGALSNTIGGTDRLENIISGNGPLAAGSYGVEILGTGTNGNLVQQDRIGTDSVGSVSFNSAHAFGGNPGPTQTVGVGIGGGAQGNRINQDLISGNSDGIHISGTGTTSNTLTNNFIGTDISGGIPLPNAGSGVAIFAGAAANTVGGSSYALLGNVISGNGVYGVIITGSGSDANVVAGNNIGTDFSGTSSVGNQVVGVALSSGAQHNIIGSPGLGTSSSFGGGLFGSHSLSFIAPSASGFFSGAGTGTSLNPILGASFMGSLDTTAISNVISGNTENGIEIDNASHNLVENNVIGLDRLATTAVPNQRDGILLFDGATSNTIGVVDIVPAANATTSGSVTYRGNLISANIDAGIEVLNLGASGANNTNNLIQANLIGGDKNSATRSTAGPGGSNSLGNQLAGILFDNSDHTGTTVGPTNNTVGGLVASTGNAILLGNSIFFNLDGGVNVQQGTGNAILGNSIYKNQFTPPAAGSPGIILNTAKNANSDSGGVHFGSVTAGPTRTFTFTLTGVSGQFYRVEFFGNPAEDTTTYAEGYDWLGYEDVTPGIHTFTLTSAPATDTFFTATSTLETASMSTSSFSPDVHNP